MRDITFMPNDYIVTHIKTDTICEHFSNDDVVYAVDERVVPLVRCKDCRFGTWDEDVEVYDCSLHKGMFEPQHYCSDGERKESRR